MKPNVILYSAQPVLAAGLGVILAGTFEIAGSFLSLESLREGVLGSSQDILLIEANSFVTLESIRDLREDAPNASVVLWVDGVAPEFISQALALGVLGIIAKTAPTATLIQCLLSVANGELWIDGKLSARLLANRNVHLTPREGQLMGLLAQGLSNKEIAWSLGITEGTTKVYLSRLFDKTGTCDRFELALLALRNLAPSSAAASETPASRDTRAVPYTLSSFVIKGASPKSPARPAAHTRPLHVAGPVRTAGPANPQRYPFEVRQ